MRKPIALATSMFITATGAALALTSTPAQAGGVAGSITRDETIDRSKYWLGRGDTWYSQSQSDAISDGDGHSYRPDCSGFVSMAWHLAKKSDGWDLNTSDFHSTSLVDPVGLDSLKPGDAVLGSEHIELFDKYVNTSDHSQGIWTYAEHDYGRKTEHNTMGWSYLKANFSGIRYTKITDAAPPPPAKVAPAMAYDQGDGSMRIYRWNSDGSSFTHTTDYDSGAFTLSAVGDRVASGDVNGDGKADIVMAYQRSDGTFAFYVWKNGNSAAEVWYTSGTFGLGNVGGRLVLGDFNGDGKAEPAMAYDKGDGTMRIYRWLSDGIGFNRTDDYDSGSFSLAAVGDRMVAGDIDGDGKDDIVMAYQKSDGTFAYYTWKNGNSAASVWYTSGAFGLGNVAGRLVLGDFNGDGKAEPAMAYDLGNGTMKIYRWLSDGTSFNRTDDYTSGAFTLSAVSDRMAAGDIDGDGKADIVMAYQKSDGTFAYYTWKNGNSAASVWYTSGSYSLTNVGGRLVLGNW